MLGQRSNMCLFLYKWDLFIRAKTGWEILNGQICAIRAPYNRMNIDRQLIHTVDVFELCVSLPKVGRLSLPSPYSRTETYAPCSNADSGRVFIPLRIQTTFRAEDKLYAIILLNTRNSLRLLWKAAGRIQRCLFSLIFAVGGSCAKAEQVLSPTLPQLFTINCFTYKQDDTSTLLPNPDKYMYIVHCELTFS